MTVDYKSTVFLPKTDFPMRAGLAKKEPLILDKWEKSGLYEQLRKAGEGREDFVLHDGPPYANGHLHIGHALNKILKDIIVRSQQMMGKNANYVPGWDCHGLPIEWKIEEKYRKKKKDKDQVPVLEFREECRQFAKEWIDIQREEFKRLGVVGNWEDPYLTMTNKAESIIAKELCRFLMNGSLYKGAKPVMWSPVEKTALAEAEVEYFDHESVTIHVRFKVEETKFDAVKDATIVIWTTTPWTIPGNRAVAYGTDIDYGVYEIIDVHDGSLARVGEKICVAEALAGEVMGEAKVADFKLVTQFKGKELEGTICSHPWRGRDYDFDVPCIAGDHVTTEAGTGFVHTAPGHGQEDWEVSMEYGIAVPDTVGPDGCYYEHVPIFAGNHVYKVAPFVLEQLTEVGSLLASGKITHSYPCSWRSKAKLIFRNTPQWFISMETNELREKALKAIDETRFVPEVGRNRIGGMIKDRPDWCVSRQRAWGVPITVFVDKKTDEPLRDQSVVDRIVAAFEEEGADAWYARDPQEFLGSEYKLEDYDQVTDILDVWFDSGVTHAFVMEERDDLSWPASLYLEGSDQHRGWFHSSLLASCGTRGRAPYDAVLTHGFVLDEKGFKMSKSMGNVTSPQDVNNQYGADILRLWVVSADTSDDLRIGPEIIKQQSDVYRRLRNTLRYMLGNLEGFSEAEKLPVEEMPELERWVLHRLFELDQQLRGACNDFVFHKAFAELHNFCAVELSAFYFDIRKDAVYCDGADSIRRRAARTVLDTLFNTLTAWLAPFMVFTCEEAWTCRFGEDAESIHLRSFPEIPANWQDEALAAKWAKVRDLRKVVTGALELKRKEKTIGSSLQAAPEVFATADYVEAMSGIDLAELSITSGASLAEGDVPAEAFTMEDVAGVGVVFKEADGGKCERCWQILPEVSAEGGICKRCEDAIG
ncbi:isoleucyl-tRNA synthetase [Candidatus Terasakiella magnetica]|uniref:Isoleucine--tRNA ligase n=1 Tax=Candidatus Terasakiella magnetica TaxID=1867952 RepID=A0A1C3RII3_9PROT|nr:isoleucine--tRNA ligase [Candidatus Terasakiella magnetica]SCA57072.1 isoleucyl-tRNA synthetase [Candidatus Terasakiella magnetica]